MFKLFNDSCGPLELIEIYAKDAANRAAINDDNTKTQVRRFYQEYISIMSGLNSNNENWDKTKIRVKMLIPKAEYTRAKKDFKSADFIDWLVENLQAIKTKEDAISFMQYFEAYVGYFYSESKKTQNNKNYSGGKR